MHQDSLAFHIQENDYFGTLATVLDLVRQDLGKQGYYRHEGTLGHLRDDLSTFAALTLDPKDQMKEFPTGPRL